MAERPTLVIKVGYDLKEDVYDFDVRERFPGGGENKFILTQYASPLSFLNEVSNLARDIQREDRERTYEMVLREEIIGLSGEPLDTTLIAAEMIDSARRVFALRRQASNRDKEIMELAAKLGDLATR